MTMVQKHSSFLGGPLVCHSRREIIFLLELFGRFVLYYYLFAAYTSNCEHSHVVTMTQWE
jgi:hypothetical protein